MRVLITGGSGFIATAVAKKLLATGNEVVVLDLKPPQMSHEKLTFVNKSIMDDLVPDIKGCDVVLHFAALLGVDNSDKRPLDTMTVNLEGSVHVFKQAISAGVKHIVFSSSSEVYGEPRQLPIRETSVKGPVSTYGVSKLAAEIYAKAFNQELGTNIKIVRFFNVYGPGQAPVFVVPIFIKKANANEPIAVFGNGSQTRCFTYVDDVADAMLVVIEKGAVGGEYNIGNNRPTTILELAEVVKEAAESSSEISTVGFGPDTRKKEREIEYRIPDITRMQELGWSPKTDVRAGIRKILELEK